MADLAKTTETVQTPEVEEETPETVEAPEVEKTPEVEETVETAAAEENVESPEVGATVETAAAEENVESSEVEASTEDEDTLEIAVAEEGVEPAEVEETSAVEGTAETAAVEPSSEETTDEIPEVLKPTSPYDLPGDWYVIHSYSGYENKVKANLETRIQSMHMEDRIFEVHIPMEDVVEFKGGKKVTVPKKVFPGYILVRMTLDDDSWYAVRNTPGVTGFVAGNAQKPTPLSRREVERFLGVQEEEEKGKPRFKPEWDVGEQVRVVTGPFADFNGIIEELNIDQQKVVVLVNIFGRDTPVELGFEDIQKN